MPAPRKYRVAIFALTSDNRVLAIKKDKPRVGETFEIPSKVVLTHDFATAVKERLAELGYRSSEVTALGYTIKKLKRSAPRIYCFLATNCKRRKKQSNEAAATKATHVSLVEWLTMVRHENFLDVPSIVSTIRAFDVFK